MSELRGVRAPGRFVAKNCSQALPATLGTMEGSSRGSSSTLSHGFGRVVDEKLISEYRWIWSIADMSDHDTLL